MATIGTASITLTDISDAIIAGSMPASTNPGQLWIDTSGVTNVLKVYKNGQWLIQELDVESMDSHLKQTIQTITDTLGTISDDNKLNHADRVMIVDSLADILGVVPSTKTTNKYPTALPDYTVLDANGSGTFASYRSSAIALGIEATSGEYIELKDAYLALINYLQLLASGNVMPWDITEANKGTILDVDSDQFRQTWLDYYMAEQALVRRILEVPGPAGAPAISGILDNDSVTIPTKADGTGGIYTRASTKMLVYVGDTNDTAKWSFSAVKDPSAGIVGSLTGNLYVVSSMAADTGYVDLTASREGYASISKRFSLTKAKQGDTVVDYWVETDYPVIVKDRDDVYTPTALTITAHTQTGTELPKSFSGIIKIEESNDGKVYTSKYTSTNPESSKVWTPSAGIKSMRIKLLTANGVNQLDYEIVQVVADGKDGADGYSPIYSELTNESMTVTTDVNGENGGYGGAESTIHIYQGQVEVTDQYNISVAISEGSGITGTRTGSTYKVTKMTADSGYVDFIATRSGYLTLTRRFTISKSKTGAAGKPATSRWLTLDTPVIRKMVTGAYFPASITMKAWQATGDQAPTAYTGRFRISINTGGSTYTVNTTTADVTSHTYSVPENVTGIKIELLSTGGATWLDEETIQVIQDGKDGAPGKDGLSAVVGFLTNENISVQATYNGAVSNYGHVKGTFEVYYGNTRVTGSNVSYSVDTANTSNLTVTIDSVTGAYSVTGITSGTSVTSGVATLKAVYEGVTITKVLTVTKSMAGTNGGNATAYWMITSAGIVSRTLDAVFTPSTITFTGKSKTGTAAPTNYSGRFVVEQTTNGNTWTSLSNTGTNVTSVTVTPTGSAIAIRAKFYLAGGTSVLLDEQTVPIVTDITDGVLNDIKDDIDDKTGTGLWKLDTYMGTTDLIPELKHTRDNTKLVKSDTVKDFTNSTAHTADTNKVYHLYTHLETAAATNIALKVDHTAGITILVNGGEPIYSSSVSGLAKTVTLPLAQGWNTVDILLRSTTTGAYVKFDKLISASVVKMSSYLGGGVSTSRLLMMQDEISFAVVQGERVAGLTITNDVINGANVEISGDTTFKDDLVMDAGSIKSKDGGVDIDLNAGTINLSKPLTINFNPVATQQQLEEIELTPGKSAYELAVDAGFVGTESQWRASLKGAPGYTPVKGTDYFDGKDGSNGTSSYLWVMYSQNANGNPMVDSPTDAKYIGVATTTTNTKPTTYSDYKWSLVKGTDGVNGEKGANGQTSYLHIKYSNDGGTTFTANNGESVGKWIGTYVDFTKADSTLVSEYTWNKVVGDDGADAKLLYLSASAETMTFNANNTPNPATQTISFTANLQNTTGIATFTAIPYNGTTAMTAITLGGSGNTRTLTQSQFPATATRIEIKAVLGGLVDTVSVVKLKNGLDGTDGTDGQNAIVGILTNESITVPASESGAVTSFAGATGTFEVYDGTTRKTGSGVTYSVSGTPSSGITVSINATTGVYTVSAMTGGTSVLSGNATLQAVYNGVTIQKVLTVTKALTGKTGATGSTGASGSNAKIVTLTSSAQIFAKNASGAISPSNITVEGVSQNTSITAWEYSVDGGTFSSVLPTGLSRTGNVVSITGSSVTAKSLSLRAKDASGVSDVLSIAVVQDGAKGLDGSKGATGATGADAYTVVLSNEAHTFAGNTSSAIASSVTVNVVAYKGATRVGATIGTISGAVEGMSTSIATNGTTTASFTVSVTTAMSTTNGILTIPITVDGKLFSKTFSFALTLKGADGANGSAGANAKVIIVNPSAQIFTKDANGNVTPSTITVDGTAQNVTISTWEYSIEGGAFSTSLPTGLARSGNKVTITGSSMTAKNISVRASGGGVSDTTTIAMVQDGARGSDGGTGAKGDNSIVGYLTNESVTLGASSTGVVSSFATASGTFRVFDGITEVTTNSACVFSLNSSTGVTLTINSSGVYTVTAMSADTATAEFKAVYKGITITKSMSLSKSRAGATGSQGAKGEDGKGISSAVVTYQNHTNGTTAPTGTWSSTIPTPVKGQYLWTRTITTYTDSSTIPTYAVAYNALDGQKGSDGATGVGISSTSIHYQLSASGSTTPTGTWLTAVPAPVKGQYLWTRTIVNYTNGTNSTAYSTSYYATDGQKGDKGDTGAKGADGVSPIVGLLTNESMTLPASSTGVVSSFTGATGTFNVYEGTVLRNASTSATYSIVSQSGITVSITQSGVYTVSAMTTGTSVLSGTATLRVVYGGVTVDKILAVTKALAGTQGATGATGGTGATGSAGQNATTYWINASVNAIKKDAKGAIVPSTITFSGFSKTGTANPVAYAGRFIVQTSTDGVSYTTAYTSTANQSSYTYTIPTTASFVKARYYLAGGTTVLLDEQTIPVLVDADGLSVGGRNLIRNSQVSFKVEYSGIAENNRLYNVGSDITTPLTIDNEYTISLRARGTIQLMIYRISATGNSSIPFVDKGELSETEFRDFSMTFRPHRDELTAIYLTTGYSTGVSGWYEVQENSLKLEKGSVDTDWTEAPEDVEDRIGQKADAESTNAEIEGIKTTLEGTVSVDDYEKQMNDYSTFMETVQTDANNAKTKSEELDILLNDPEKGIVTNLGDAYTKINSLEGYLSYDGVHNILTLARTAKSSTKIMISDTSIDFMDGTDQVASITNQYLKIERGIFANSVQVSKHIIMPDDDDPDHLVFTYLG